MRPSMMEQLHVFFLNLAQAVVTARKENAKTVTDCFMSVPSSRPGNTRNSSQEQAVLLHERMLLW
jgi:hypothetical protein